MSAPPPAPRPSRMAAEIAEIPAVAARLAGPGPQAALAEIAARARRLAPPAVLTLARGSSDHAATCLAYAMMLGLGLPVASLPPSVASVNGQMLAVRGMLGLAISQSGQSPDLVASAAMLARAGAEVVVLTNRPDSPLAVAGVAFDIAAGPEQAVAATKSFVASILAGLWLVAHWSGDRRLAAALAAMPEALDAALAAGPGDLAGALAGARHVTAIARGPALGLAAEAALKLRELAGRPADGFSAAEVLHGPSALLTGGAPVLVFGAADAPGLAEAETRLTAQGARLIRLSARLPAPPAPARHPFTAALPQIVPVYAALEGLARAEGRDPDRPAHLSKETATR